MRKKSLLFRGVNRAMVSPKILGGIMDMNLENVIFQFASTDLMVTGSAILKTCISGSISDRVGVGDYKSLYNILNSFGLDISVEYEPNDNLLLFSNKDNSLKYKYQCVNEKDVFNPPPVKIEMKDLKSYKVNIDRTTILNVIELLKVLDTNIISMSVEMHCFKIGNQDNHVTVPISKENSGNCNVVVDKSIINDIFKRNKEITSIDIELYNDLLCKLNGDYLDMAVNYNVISI